MIVAIMQPYFFPYIGYFQLMNSVDLFVFHDDVQYVKQSWINRNRIRSSDAAIWLTLPVGKAEHQCNINDRHYMLGREIAKVKQRLKAAYRNAPAYSQVAPFILDLLDFTDDNVAKFNANLLTQLAAILRIGCSFAFSSEIAKPDALKGEEKVIELCRRLGADHYINPIGGVDLYDHARFAEDNLDLKFLRTAVKPVELKDGPAQLSIIDVLMFNGIDGTRKLLDDYMLEGRK